MSIRVTIKNTEEFQAALANVDEKLKEATARAIQELGQMIKDQAYTWCPVRTGFLRSTIFYRTTGEFSVNVGATAGYAGFVEFGTSKMHARPFLQPAIDNSETQFLGVFRNIFAEALGVY